MKKIHVVLVISSLGGGGAERVMVDLAGFLVEQGVEVTLVTLEGDREDQYLLPPDVRRVRVNIMWASEGWWGRLVSSVKRLQLIRQRVREIAPDVIISFIDMTNVRVLLSLLGMKTPVIVSERTDPRHHPIGRIWGALRWLSYRRAVRVVVQTQGVAAWASRWLPRRRVEIIPNAVRSFDLAKPKCRPNGMPEQRVVVGVGRLGWEKGFDYLVLAFSRSGLADMGWSLVILGEGSARFELTRLVESLGLSGQVFLPGMQAAPDEWLRSADIFALSSRYEGFPNALLEAMQCGVASLAFNCESGPAEIIRHGVDGWLVPPADAGSLGDALRRLAEDEEQRVSLGEQAQSVLQRFSRQNVYGKWLSLCETVVSESESGK